MLLLYDRLHDYGQCPAVASEGNNSKRARASSSGLPVLQQQQQFEASYHVE
jgi:hypothetical protein